MSHEDQALAMAIKFIGIYPAFGIMSGKSKAERNEQRSVGPSGSRGTFQQQLVLSKTSTCEYMILEDEAGIQSYTIYPICWKK